MSFYLRYDGLQSGRRSLAARLGPLLAPPLLALLALPLAKPILFWFLDRSPEILEQALAGLLLRLGLLVCGACALLGHGLVVRSADRAILDPHPMDPQAWLVVLRRRLLRESAPLMLALGLSLLPLALQGHRTAFALALFIVVESWLCGVGLGLATPFVGIWAARSESLQGILNAVRGGQPRMQAGMIYAPGLALGLCGLSLLGALQGMGALSGGDFSPWAILLPAPMLLGLIALLTVPRLAAAWWYAATQVTAEVDAEWAQLAEKDLPATREPVYLEWLARFLPDALRIHFLRTLRQAWRSQRGWIVGAWALGGLGALAGWSSDPGAGFQVLLLGTAALGLLSSLAIRMEIEDPPSLKESIGLPHAPSLLGRLLALFAILQAIVIPSALALIIRQGVPGLTRLAALELCALLLSAVATLSSPLRARALWLHVPFALCLWILVLRSLP